MSFFCRAAVAGIVLAGTTLPVLAQEPANPLAALQAKEALTGEDTAAVRAWIGERVTGVVGQDPAVAQQAFNQLRSEFKGTNAFKEAYVRTCVETLGSAYKKADLVPAARLITVLNLLDDLRTLDVLLESLRDDRAAVRAAAAVALRNLRPKIAANADALGRTIDALRAAGRKEPGREVLQLIYRALDYTNTQPTPNLKTAAGALLDILDERVRQFDTAKVRAEGADAVGLAVAGALRAAMEQADQKRYTIILAKALHYAVTRYTQGDSPLGKVSDKTGGPDEIALRDATELLIKDAEQQLTEILKPDTPPNVTQKMQAANHTEMVNEMNNWAKIFSTELNLDLQPMQDQPPGDG